MDRFSIADVSGGLAAFGPFFELDTHRRDSSIDAGWLSMDRLVSDGSALRDRVQDVRAALAEAADVAVNQIEWKVAASVAQLGLVSRLLSPVLGIAALTGQVVDVELSDFRWQPTVGSLFPLSVSATVTSRSTRSLSSGPGPAGPARDLLFRPIATLIDATRSIGPISEQVLWGNVASAINGATNMIVTRRPDLTSVAYPVASELMKQATGSAAGGEVGPAFRRDSCCLIYRIALDRRGALCGDCVLG